MSCCGRTKRVVVNTPAPSAPVRATPDARYTAQRLGVNLALVKGTGRDGLIRKEDVEAFAHAG